MGSRPSALAAVSIVAAVVGGSVALLGARALGDEGGTGGVRTVVLPGPSGPPPAAGAKPGAFDPAGIYAARSRGVVTVYVEFRDHPGGGAGGQGSGFVVSRDGIVLTSAHVVTTAGTVGAAAARPASTVYIEFADGDRAPAEIVGWDLFSDVGVLRVDPEGRRLEPVPLGDSGSVRVGDPVAAIGSPFGEQSSLSVGVVSAVHRSIDALTSDYAITDAIQTDTPINHGNSGGPLLDARGSAVGINAQIRTDSGVAEGVGFAVPVNTARRSLRQLLENGRVSYGYVGVGTDDVTPSVARALGLRALRGALVVRVEPGSPAARAGLRGGTRLVTADGRRVRAGGDVVLAIGGRPVAGSSDLAAAASRLEPGRPVPFLLERDGRRVTVRVRIGERPLVPRPA